MRNLRGVAALELEKGNLPGGRESNNRHALDHCLRREEVRTGQLEHKWSLGWGNRA
jgi:hypothetical protein